MKKRTIAAAIATPLVGGVLGFFVSQQMGAAGVNAITGPCAAPTLYIDMADTGSLVTGGPNAVASCEGDRCSVQGAEQVEVQTEGRVQCVAVGAGQELALTRHGDNVSYEIDEIGR
jgi:hypothetical protein